MSCQKIWHILEKIPDPEIPVISIVELGMIRDVIQDGELTVVKLTPTYTGCPAMHQIEQDIKKALKENDISSFRVDLVHSPAWNTDWITDEAKEKLRVYGIAPPLHSSTDKNSVLGKLIQCPRCASKNTRLISQFGSTACKALYKCEDCLEPFDYFKCHK